MLPKEVRLSSFRSECEAHCRRELEARMISLVATGDHVEIRQSVTTTRLYQNLTESVPFMAFYDVKNARLCNIFEGEGLMHREPILDSEDLERFLATVVPLMRAGRDLIWVLAGRADSNISKLRKILAASAQFGEKLRSETFYLCYNAKQMQQYGHWKRQRGVANSKSVEQLFCIYKGKMPKAMPKSRQHVDPGSPLFSLVMRNVPVLAPRHQAMVGRDVREQSLASMTGTPHHEDEVEKEKEMQDATALLDQHAPEASTSLDADSLLAAVIKRRKLYRQLTGAEVPWFPP